MKSLAYLVTAALLCVRLMAVSGDAPAVRVDLIQSGTNFTYVLSNDELVGGQTHVSGWHLVVAAPFQVVSSPPGWSYTTDNHSYVQWFSTDDLAPYPNDIAPGATLGQFTLSSIVPTTENLPIGVSSWQPSANAAGPTLLAAVESPSVLTLAAALSDPNWSDADQTFRCRVAGVPTLRYTVEVSTDLSQWTELTSDVSPFTFVNSGLAAVGTRYFRAVYADEFQLADIDAESETDPDSTVGP